MAKESSYGSSITYSGGTYTYSYTPTSFYPFTGCTLEPDPGLFFPSVMMGYRDLNIFNLYGQQKNTGAVDGPLFPTNGIEFLIASVGFDGGSTPQSGYANTDYLGGYGVEGTKVSTTPTTLASATPTSGSVTSVSTVAIPGGLTTTTIVGNYIQIDVNDKVAGTTTSEVRLVTMATGSSNPYTLTFAGEPLNFYNHASGADVYLVKAPFTHYILQANILPSLAIEKSIGGYESLLFGGCRVNKYDIKSASTDTETQCTVDIVAKNSVPIPPSSPTIVSEEPFVFAECTAYDLFGNVLAATYVGQASTFNMSIDNALKSTYTHNQQRTLQYLTPVTRKITGDFAMVFFSLDDTNYGYEQMMLNAQQGSLQFTLAHPSTTPTNFTTGSSESITVIIPQVQFSKYADDLKMDDVVMSTINWEASLNLTNSSSNTGPPNPYIACPPEYQPATIGLEIVNSVCLPY